MSQPPDFLPDQGEQPIAAGPEGAPALPRVESLPYVDVPPPELPGPATPPRRRRHRGRYWLALVAALALAVGGAVIAVTSYLGASRPESVVHDYLTALAHGDAAGALAYGDLPDGPHTLLTDVVLRAQNAVAQLSDPEVLAVEQTGATAQASIRYTLEFPSGRRLVTDTVGLTREGRTWRLTRVAVPVQITVAEAAQRARLAGRAVPKGTQLLFPGALPVAFDAPTLAVVTGDAVVRFSKPGPLTANVEVTAAARASIGSAVDAAFTACLSGASHDPLCPTPDEQRVIPGTLRGAATGRPSSSMTISVDALPAGRIIVAAAVSVNARFQALDFNNLPVAKSGTEQVHLDAYVSPDTPGAIVWRAA